MSQISIVDLNPTSVSLFNLSNQSLNQIRGGFGAAPLGEDGLPLFDYPKWDYKPIKIEGRLIIPQ